MASDKRRHKDAKIAREKLGPSPKAQRQMDRDRRWRKGPTADQGLKDKMARLMPSEYLQRSPESE